MAGDRWLPIDFVFEPSSTAVKWLDFGEIAISDPFFYQTLEKLTSANPPAKARTTDLKTLLEAAGDLPLVRPSGLIFHISRCGSTLIANALRTGDRVLVLSEALPICSFFDPFIFEESCFLPDAWDTARTRLLETVATVYAHNAGKPGCKIIIKCYAINLLHIRMIRAIWPSVPCVISIRDPVEVMISNFRRPAGWVKWKGAPRAFGWHEDEVRKIAIEEWCARGVGRLLSAALEAVDGSCKVIDYRNIEPIHLQKIADFFNVDIAASHSAVFGQVMATDAKDPQQKRRFEADREWKQGLATKSTREAAKLWAEGPYELLRATASW
jgi:hypothetical protein